MFIKAIKWGIGFRLGGDIYRWAKKTGGVIIPFALCAIGILFIAYVALWLPVRLGFVMGKNFKNEKVLSTSMGIIAVLIFLNTQFPLTMLSEAASLGIIHNFIPLSHEMIEGFIPEELSKGSFQQLDFTDRYRMATSNLGMLVFPGILCGLLARIKKTKTIPDSTHAVDVKQ